MSALHHGRVQVAPDAAGRLVYTSTAVEYPVPGWPGTGKPDTAAPGAAARIPAPRRSTDNATTPARTR